MKKARVVIGEGEGMSQKLHGVSDKTLEI